MTRNWHTLRWLRQHDEREYSFVNATSFAFMRAKGISEALAFDGNFAAAGFNELRPEALGERNKGPNRLGRRRSGPIVRVATGRGAGGRGVAGRESGGAASCDRCRHRNIALPENQASLAKSYEKRSSFSPDTPLESQKTELDQSKTLAFQKNLTYHSHCRWSHYKNRK